VEVERFELSSAIVPYRLSITSIPGHPRVCSHLLVLRLSIRWEFDICLYFVPPYHTRYLFAAHL